MYPGLHAQARADQPAIIMAGSGETVTYRELEARSNRFAHLLRVVGLKRRDHYAVFMENHPRFIESDAAGERSGLYYTNVNSFLTAGELAYIVNNSLSKVLITSQAKLEVALSALRECPNVELCLVVDGPGEGARVRNLGEATAEFPISPIDDESPGAAMLYSSGTTGRPKGILRPLYDHPVSEPHPVLPSYIKNWRFREGVTYLMPAPLYHSAPMVGAAGTIRLGGDAHRDGAVRRRALPASYRETPRDPHPACADDVLADAETAGSFAPAVRPLFARGGGARRRALSRSGERGDDRMVGAGHPRVLRRD